MIISTVWTDDNELLQELNLPARQPHRAPITLYVYLVLPMSLPSERRASQPYGAMSMKLINWWQYKIYPASDFRPLRQKMGTPFKNRQTKSDVCMLFESGESLLHAVEDAFFEHARLLLEKVLHLIKEKKNTIWFLNSYHLLKLNMVAFIVYLMPVQILFSYILMSR